MKAEEKKPLFLQYVDMISRGEWRGYVEELPAATVASELSMLCHAALFSKNSVAAVDFLEAVQAKLVGAKTIPPELCGLLKKTMERADAVMNDGGWQKITEKPPEADLRPRFPVGAFPPVIEEYLDNVAKLSQVRREMVYPQALAALALCTQGKYKVEYPDATRYRQHLCLYIGIVADPSERKSPVFQRVILKPFYKWYNDVKGDYEAEKARYKAERKVLLKQLEVAEKGCASKEKAATAVDDITGLEAKLAEKKPPRNPYFLFDDTTPEALARCLLESGENGGIFSEEGDFMEILAGRYADKGKSQSPELVLKAYNAEPVRVNRVSSGELMLERPLLSMCLMLQPELYNRIVANKNLQGRGCIARFLFCVPERTAGTRKAINNDTFQLSGGEVYEEILRKFLEMDRPEEQAIPVLRFAKELCSESSDLGKHLQWLENTMQTGSSMEAQSPYAGKAGGKLVRIAGLLHLLWGYDQSAPISAETANRAVQIHQFFFGEKLKEMQTEENREEKLVQRITRAFVRHTLEKGLAYLPQRDFYMKVKGGDLNSMEQFRGILETLEERNVLQTVCTGNKKLVYASPFLYADL